MKYIYYLFLKLNTNISLFKKSLLQYSKNLKKRKMRFNIVYSSFQKASNISLFTKTLLPNNIPFIPFFKFLL